MGELNIEFLFFIVITMSKEAIIARSVIYTYLCGEISFEDLTEAIGDIDQYVDVIKKFEYWRIMKAIMDDDHVTQTLYDHILMFTDDIDDDWALDEIMDSHENPELVSIILDRSDMGATIQHTFFYHMTSLDIDNIKKFTALLDWQMTEDDIVKMLEGDVPLQDIYNVDPRIFNECMPPNWCIIKYINQCPELKHAGTNYGLSANKIIKNCVDLINLGRRFIRSVCLNSTCGAPRIISYNIDELIPLTDAILSIGISVPNDIFDNFLNSDPCVYDEGYKYVRLIVKYGLKIYKGPYEEYVNYGQRLIRMRRLAVHIFKLWKLHKRAEGVKRAVIYAIMREISWTASYDVFERYCQLTSPIKVDFDMMIDEYMNLCMDLFCA
jgi:hypothetical protein